MPIISCLEHRYQTLEEFYSEWANSDNNISSDIGKAMLRVVEKINQTFIETTIYGGTSHAHLQLFVNETNWESWYITIIANSDAYLIEYRMSKNKKTWGDALVKGATKSLDEFINYIIIAMTECEAWASNMELKRLYKKIKEVDATANA